MTRDWKTGEPIEDPYHCWRDPILEDEFGITERDWNTVIQQTVAHVRNWTDQSIASRVSGIVDLLLPPLDTLWQGKDGALPFRWLPCRSLPGATVADHSLTASAIAYCLGYDDGFHTEDETLDYLRLSALTATWKADGLGEVCDTLWTGLSPIEPKADGNSLERIVYLAKTVASERTSINAIDPFSTHPLKEDNPDQRRQVGLVLGGATKIKGYFLESARLPETRGASALLDRINLEDVPALFGREIPHDPKRSARFQKDFCERTGHSLSAPECIIYAAGGNTLAFSPTSIVYQIADEIERIYTKETLVANSVAVGNTFDLLELQYGLNPTDFWIEDFRRACNDAETSELMESYYGSKNDKDFLKRKCFGELTTKLASAQFHRREGNPSYEGNRTTQRNFPTHIETGPYHQRCESCERRPAIIHSPRARCEACTRKYVVGRITKKESDLPADQMRIKYYLEKLSGWQPATPDEQGGWCLRDWSSLFKEYLQVTGKAEQYIKNQELKEIQGPQRLKTIAEASDPTGFITFIYADGNNMGGYLENIETPAQYRQFSERVFIALQKATFDALAEHLNPTTSDTHPFEIVSIGGDDLLLIVPGSKAFEVVHAISKNFDHEFNSHSKFAEIEKDKLRESQRYTPTEWVDQRHMQPAFSLSLGFVIADEHTPVGFLEHLANSLLRSAKTRAKTLKKPEVGYFGGTLDFLVLKSFSMITSELADFRKKFYKTDTENSLTMRPFTLHELSGLIQTIQALKDKKGKFPRSQLYQLRQSLRLGRQTSTLDYFYFRSRLRDGKGKLLQRELERNWQGTPDIPDGQGPWYALPQKHGNSDIRYETLLFDIIEAYEFIPEPDDQTEEKQQ